MSHGILNRLRILIRADAHGVLESLEDRSLLLKQCVREAEVELAERRARRDALDQQTTELERRRRCEKSSRL